LHVATNHVAHAAETLSSDDTLSDDEDPTENAPGNDADMTENEHMTNKIQNKMKKMLDLRRILLLSRIVRAPIPMLIRVCSTC
jgi:hypothetical protein